MTQAMEARADAEPLRLPAPGRREGIARPPPALPVREHEILAREPALPQQQAALQQHLAVRHQSVSDDGGERDVANAGFALGAFEAQPAGLSFLQARTYLYHLLLQVDVLPAKGKD